MKIDKYLKKRRIRIQYAMTWVSLAVLMITGSGLMILSWNGALSGSPRYALMVMLWIFIAGSGIYLFMLGAKKAHRLLIDEKRGQEEAEKDRRLAAARKPSASQEKKSLDSVSMARKLVRRFPGDAPMEECGRVLLNNLSKELEIMSGIFYLRKKDQFESVANFALSPRGEPFVFKLGEGLTGQVARDRQILLLTKLPEEFLDVYSGLGKAKPSYLAIVPLVHKDQTVAVLECTGYRFEPAELESMFRIFARDVMDKVGPTLK